MTVRRYRVTGIVMAAIMLTACAHTKTEVAAKNETPPSPPAAAAPAPAPEPAPPPPAAIAPEAPSFQDAYFDFDQSLIREDAKQPLEQDAAFLKNHRDLKVTIGGYCDERGTSEYNLALGNRRAEAVKRYLVALGVEPAQMKTISYGKERPFCTEHTEACYQENRRGHFLTSADGM
ncbi:MAG TPA: peptidoglycan-associated lipoprotein Pal [Nitrospiria bacterium]|nr:peptidoglycan-associated lipoprotein Pal [Nitrospiria bacterium]